MKTQMKLIAAAAAALTGVAGAAQGATMLAAGDVAIIGYNSSNPDTVAFVALKPFDAGTSLVLTDYGWSSTNNTFRFGGEGYIQATAKRDFAAGEVFVIESAAATPAAFSPAADFDFQFDATTGAGGGAAQYAPSAAGDGTILFQGTIDDANATWSGTLLYAINAEGTTTNGTATGWQANAADSNTSALPSGLVNGTTAIGLAPTGTTEFNDYQYTGTRTGTQAELLAAIGNRANWEGRDGNYAFGTTAFTVTPVPEPAALSLLALGGVALLARRRRAAAKSA